MSFFTRLFIKLPPVAKPVFMSPPISRNSLVWLFVVQVFILAPHFLSAPPWIVLIWLAVVFWRWKIFQGAWNYPNKLYKTCVVLICSAGLIASLGINFSFISMVSLLLVGFILKLLEIKNRKDFVLLIYVAFFLLATQFIVFNHFMAAFYGFFCLILLCTLLIQLYQGEVVSESRLQQYSLSHYPAYKKSFLKNVWQNVFPSAAILLQAIPFMFILFVAMPRFSSFWAVPNPQQTKTGMSDSMSPGDISELIKSDELAFRVTFENKVPANEKLYWRNLVFSYFDGRRWTQAQPYQQLSQHQLQQQSQPQDLKTSSQPIFGWRENIKYLGDRTTYHIIAEASGQPWLFALAAPEVWSNNYLMGRDLHLQATLPVTRRISYTVTSALDYYLDEGGQGSDILNQNLQLPALGNPETRRLAHAWFAESGTTEKLIEKLFRYFNKSFFYTLRPPSLGGDTVDEFLWQSRQGFCEHFASSFVFFMRAAGIPARVVVGYQGGELNQAENYLIVRQRDAHAWAEVWVKDHGWVLYDPTSAVAPERIQKGIAESLSVSDQTFLGKSFGSSFKYLMVLRYQWDAINYQWIRWVLNYDSGLQSSLFDKFLKDVNPLRIALLLLGAGAISMIFIFTILFFRYRHKKLPLLEHFAQKFYLQLCQKLKRCGLVPDKGESLRHFVLRAANERPDLRRALTKIADLYEQLVYAENTSVLLALKDELASFSPSNKPIIP